MNETDTYHAVMATGLDSIEAARLIRELVQAGDLLVTWNRDFGWYTPVRDPWGDPATKANAGVRHE